MAHNPEPSAGFSILGPHTQLRMETAQLYNNPNAKKSLKKINKESPGSHSRDEVLELTNTLNMSLGWGIEEFVCQSKLHFGKESDNDELYPSEVEDRPSMYMMTDMHVVIGKAKGFLEQHLRMIGFNDPIHRLHDNALNGLKRSGAWQVSSLGLAINKAWRGLSTSRLATCNKLVVVVTLTCHHHHLTSSSSLLSSRTYHTVAILRAVIVGRRRGGMGLKR